MHTDRITQIIQFALARARREDHGFGDLGVIHLLKLLYLADLAFAEAHGGESFSGIPWVFYHFGPWNREAWEHTVAVLEAPEIEPRSQISGAFERRTYRFRYERDGDEVFSALDSRLPLEVTRTVSSAVHEYGADTKRLLHHVYNTTPMRATIPGCPIDFSRFIIGEATQVRTAQAAPPELSKTQQKKADDAKAHLRDSIATKAAARQAALLIPLPALNEKELAALEELTRILSEDEDQAPMDLHGEMVFSPEFWSSDFRREHGLS
jgi:hypothetical protein